MKPDFLYIGPDKSGSTWLYHQFIEHKSVSIPEAKDLYFFDRSYYKGIEWYEDFFIKNDGGIAGEISHDYLFSHEALQRIHHDYPDIKILTILRNPIDKIWSHYLFLIRSGITRINFEEALRAFPELIEKAQYSYGIEECLRLFERKQLGVFYFDALVESPKKLIDDICDFLGVDKSTSDRVGVNPLPASKPRNFFIAKIAKKSAILLRVLGLENILGFIKRNAFIKHLLYKPYKDRPKMKEEHKRYLLEKYFIPDIERLEKLLDKDLSSWKL